MAPALIDELNEASALARLLATSAPLLRRLLLLVSLVLKRNLVQSSYENLSLSLNLDIQDVKGWRAVLRRVQHVRFLTSEAGVIRDVAWGEGTKFARYQADGLKFV